MKACQHDLLAFVVLLQLTTIGSLASVYPTQPIADTVFTSGDLAQILWKDDGWTPHLKYMGLMNIDLYVNSVGSDMNIDYYVTTLARDVAPITCAHTAIIPLNLPPNASFYVLHFKTSSLHSHWYPKSHQHPTPRPHTHSTIYSANFQIAAPTTQTANSNTNTDMLPIISLLQPQSQFMPTSTPTSASENATATSGPQRNDSNSGDANQQDAQATLQNGNSHWERMDTTRFRLLFMLWPALVGFSMAL